MCCGIMIPSILKSFFIVHLCVVFGACQLIRSSSNTALIAGQRLELTCQPEINYIVREWTSQSPFSSNTIKIYTDWSYPRIVGSQRFGYIKENNSVTLYLNSTEHDDAGIFNCSFQLEAKQLEHFSAQIIILETEPVCEDNITTASNVTLEQGSIVWMRCSLNFRGNLAPTMEWRQSGRTIDMDNRTIIDMVETSVTPNANITSTLTIVVKSTFNATFFTCKTHFQWENTSSLNSSAATNAPDYSYTWNSSVIIVPATIVDQEGTSTVFASASALTVTEKTQWLVANAIYLVAGVAVLFGVASSLIAVCLCLRLRRKNSAAIAELDRFDREEPFMSQYDLIPYAITDGYDSIEEVDIKDDVMDIHFPPRQGPLPEPGYSCLMPDEPKPPGVYSRMNNPKLSENDVDGEKHQLIALEAALDQLKPSDEKMTSEKSSNSYLDLRSSVHKDIVDVNEEMPSAYLQTCDVPLQSTTSTYLTLTEEPCLLDTVDKNTKEVTGILGDDIPSAYLTTMDAESSNYDNRL